MPEILYAVEVPEDERFFVDDTPTRYEIESRPDKEGVALVVYGVYSPLDLKGKTRRIPNPSCRWLVQHLLYRLRMAESCDDVDRLERLRRKIARDDVTGWVKTEQVLAHIDAAISGTQEEQGKGQEKEKKKGDSPCEPRDH